MRQVFASLILIFLTIYAGNAISQTGDPFGNSGTFTGGLGMTMIDDESYFAINLRPDISIGKFGVGLNINLL